MELQDKRQNRMLNRMPIQGKINNLVGELARDHVAMPTRRLLDSTNDRRA